MKDEGGCCIESSRNDHNDPERQAFLERLMPQESTMGRMCKAVYYTYHGTSINRTVSSFEPSTTLGRSFPRQACPRGPTHDERSSYIPDMAWGTQLHGASAAIVLKNLKERSYFRVRRGIAESGGDDHHLENHHVMRAIQQVMRTTHRRLDKARRQEDDWFFHVAKKRRVQDSGSALLISWGKTFMGAVDGKPVQRRSSPHVGKMFHATASATTRTSFKNFNHARHAGQWWGMIAHNLAGTWSWYGKTD